MSEIKLMEIVEDSGLQKSKSESLVKSFQKYFADAKKIADASKKIVVSSESDTEGMRLARENRLKLKSVRIEADKLRKELKEQSLREGRAIDGVANVLKALIVPVEQHLEKQEKYAEILEQKRIEDRFELRVSKLEKYVDDVYIYQIREMNDEAFDNLLENCKLAYEQRLEAERQAEKDRAERERAMRVYNDRRVEIAPYIEYVAFDFQLSLGTTDEAYKVALSSGKEGKKKAEAEAARVRAENEKLREQAQKAQLEQEKIMKKLEAEKQAQAKKEAAEKARVAAEQKAKDEAERAAMLAPDRIKLIKLAEFEGVEMPAVKSSEAQEIVNQVDKSLHSLSNWINEQARKL